MMAQELRRRATRTTETYIAYGATEMLVKECARVGNYSIPQTQEKGVETPKTKDGEDLGVGEGWWYTGTVSTYLSPLIYSDERGSGC